MAGRVKLTSQASEELVAPNSSQKRSASDASTATTKKRKSSEKRKSLNVCTYSGCGKTFTRPCRLEEHIRSHTGERPFKCTADPGNCDKSFLRDSHLKAHVKALHLKEKLIRCTFMIVPGTEDDRGVFGFKRKAPGDAPMINGGDEEELRECGATFATNQHLKRHLESHMKTLPHVCTKYPPCSAGFRKRGPLRRHIRSEHLKLLPWGCTYKDIEDPEKECTAAFDTKGKLGGHIDTVHKCIIPARYVCTMCTTHMNGEEKIKSVPEKDHTVRSANEIEERAGISLGNDPSEDEPMENPNSGSSTSFPIIRSVLISEIVGKTQGSGTARLQGKVGFKTYLDLRRHTIKMHPPTCVQCQYTFKSGRNLKYHITNTHGADVEERRRFICEQCGTGFTKSHALKIHIRRIHEGLRPFTCPSCPKTYGYKSQLQVHIENHHSGRKNAPRKSRGGSARKQNLIQQLTGIGYEDSGRNIKCVVDGCDYRFFRVYALKKHLESPKYHGFDESQVEELVGDVEKAMQEGVEDSEDEDEMTETETETDSSGSGSDGEGDMIMEGMRYASLWDGMSDMDLDGDDE